ncbi:MAG: hypothetical protein OXE75_12125 [bacterium]|nr:hypothetical protein [bacterium]
METIIASLIGVVGVVLSALVFWVGSAVKDLRTAMDTRFDKVDERFEKVDERFDKIDERFERVYAVLRQHGERTARIEGGLGASGILAPPPLADHDEPVVETSGAEAATS